MKDGSIDAMFWSGGLPTSGITDLFTSQRGNVKLLDVTNTLDKLKEINTIYERGVIPAATYQSPTDVPTVVVPPGLFSISTRTFQSCSSFWPIARAMMSDEPPVEYGTTMRTGPVG